jgi:murein DD-endopeptidase MepM/ murein hydrolase activator NlpD
MKNLFIIIVLLVGQPIFSQQKMDEIPESLSEEIMQQVRANAGKLAEFKQWLAAKNEMTENAITTPHVQFRWPMRVNSNYDDVSGYYVISNYMDQNRDNNQSQSDWYCRGLNYKGHEGNDYSLYPFFWRMMNNSNVYASAGAAGVVVAARDNINNENNCLRDTFEITSANYVAIMHEDSSISRYLHVRTGSVKVVIGQFVNEGQILATIGSSGRSSNPHLHFDLQHYRVNNNQYNFIEPFVPPDTTQYNCNNFANVSWWKNQKDYIEPNIVRVMTHSGTPIISGVINNTLNENNCPEDEDAKAKNQFAPGERVTIGIALVHTSQFDSTYTNIYYPNGTLWTSLSSNVTNLYSWYGAYYMTLGVTLPADAPTGAYIIKTEFIYRKFDPGSPFYPANNVLSKTASHYFTVGCTTTKSIMGTVTGESAHIVSTSLSSTQTISNGSITRYQSAGFIELKPGFNAVAGSVFKARIRDCNFSD